MKISKTKTKYILLPQGKKEIINHTSSVTSLALRINSNPTSLGQALKGELLTLKMLNKIKKIFRNWKEGIHYEPYKLEHSDEIKKP
jgi:hypothetical protein